jgi:Holliday junction resolvase-like predicted endonuclease
MSSKPDRLVKKSSRHSKITGDFAEALVLYWLSKYGFECFRVDHTGIDLFARKPHSKELMGISVKSRSRELRHADESITLEADDFEKAQAACEEFHCVPYFAIVADVRDMIRVFVMKMDHLLQVCPRRKWGAYWKITQRYLDQYYADPEIMIFEFRTKTHRWWEDQAANLVAKTGRERRGTSSSRP